MIIARKIYLHFYCLPISEALVWILGAAVVFLLLRWLIGHHALWRRCINIAALVWMMAIVTCTLILRSQDTGSFHVSWVPLHSYVSLMQGANIEVLRMNFMNTVLFYPLGLLGSELLPREWTLRKRLVYAACFAMILSSGIEIIQFLSRRGYAEMDDIIHNTAGMCLGVLTAGLPVIPVKREVSCNE